MVEKTKLEKEVTDIFKNIDINISDNPVEGRTGKERVVFIYLPPLKDEIIFVKHYYSGINNNPVEVVQNIINMTTEAFNNHNRLEKLKSSFFKRLKFLLTK